MSTLNTRDAEGFLTELHNSIINNSPNIRATAIASKALYVAPNDWPKSSFVKIEFDFMPSFSGDVATKIGLRLTLFDLRVGTIDVITFNNAEKEGNAESGFDINNIRKIIENYINTFEALKDVSR